MLKFNLRNLARRLAIPDARADCGDESSAARSSETGGF